MNPSYKSSKEAANGEELCQYGKRRWRGGEPAEKKRAHKSGRMGFQNLKCIKGAFYL